jgi:hypothetical protein
LKQKHRGYGDTFSIDEVFVKFNGKQHYLHQPARPRTKLAPTHICT